MWFVFLPGWNEKEHQSSHLLRKQFSTELNISNHIEYQRQGVPKNMGIERRLKSRILFLIFNALQRIKKILKI